jgi:glycerol dehydrogenase
MLEGASTEFIDKIVSFFVDIGLPVTLAEVGVNNPSEQTLVKIARKENHDNGLFRNEPFPVTDKMIVDAIRAADTLGRRYHEERRIWEEPSSKWQRSA